MSDAEQKKLLYLVSSTAMPYINDILDIVFLPAGYTYRFRYDLKWVSDDLQSQTQLDDITNEGLIVHARLSEQQVNDVTEYHNEELVPVRKVTIYEKKIVGDFVIIQFRLGNYLEFPRIDVGSKNLYHDSLEKIAPPKTMIGTRYRSSKLLFVGNSIDMKFVDDSLRLSDKIELTNNWTNLVSHFATFKPHGDNKSIFLKLLDITNVADNSIVTLTQLSSDLYGFELYANTTYRIRVLQRSYMTITSPFNLELTADTSVIKLIKPQALIQGKYDVLELIIATSDIEKPKYTSFVIKPEDCTLASVTSFTCNCRIKTSNLKRNFLVGLLVAGIAAIGFSSFVEDGSIRFLLPAIGTAFVAIASWALKR